LGEDAARGRVDSVPAFARISRCAVGGSTFRCSAFAGVAEMADSGFVERAVARVEIDAVGFVHAGTTRRREGERQTRKRDQCERNEATHQNEPSITMPPPPGMSAGARLPCFVGHGPSKYVLTSINVAPNALLAAAA
jgi:hypothetical protein